MSRSVIYSFSGKRFGFKVSIYKFGVSNEIRRTWCDMTTENWPKDKNAMLEKLMEVGIINDIYSDKQSNNDNGNSKKRMKNNRKRIRKRKKY